MGKYPQEVILNINGRCLKLPERIINIGGLAESVEIAPNMLHQDVNSVQKEDMLFKLDLNKPTV
ncbi:MAG: hypothetical protein ACXWTN_01055 [Methylosarcina sp.]